MTRFIKSKTFLFYRIKRIIAQFTAFVRDCMALCCAVAASHFRNYLSVNVFSLVFMTLRYKINCHLHLSRWNLLCVHVGNTVLYRCPWFTLDVVLNTRKVQLLSWSSDRFAYLLSFQNVISNGWPIRVYWKLFRDSPSCPNPWLRLNCSQITNLTQKGKMRKNIILNDYPLPLRGFSAIMKQS